ncbi:MAG: valine--tRNA ligase [Amylibacter sp.]|nr:valine--tRNA ligase [Amylibacter sp.]
MAMEKNFDAAANEAALFDKWMDAKAFKAGANAKEGMGSFCIMIPPPNVTGSLHMGHAFNNTLQDIMVRWHRMRGFDTLWQPGQDHAGIATQMVVERDMAANGEGKRTDMTREQFVKRVWQQKEKSGNIIINQLKRLGASCDWDRNRFTMDEGFHDAVLKVFVDLYNKGMIYKGKRLVNWDPHFETAISDLEVENVEVDGHMWHFKYPLAGGETYEYVEKDEDGNVTLTETRDYISIATTRPETMLGDGAVAVFTDDPRYAPIVGKQVHLPLCDRTIPIITDEYPDPDFGSGAVKITGAHDFNDYMVAKRNDIPMYSLLDTKGHMRDDVADDNLVPEKYRGMDRFEARKAVIADIDALGLMIKIEDKKVMQPFGDRSKVVIEPMLTDQWFVHTKKLVRPAIEAVKNGTVQILPEGDKKVYFHWLENIEPWCISRQLWWGHQVPVWYGPKLSNDLLSEVLSTQRQAQDAQGTYHFATNDSVAFCATNEAEAIEKAKVYYGRWFKPKSICASRDADETSADNGLTPPTLRASVSLDVEGGALTDQDRFDICLTRDTDVLDTWFSSGLWPFGTLGWPENTDELERYYKSDNVNRVLITGFDIIFFWVARMMMMGIEVMDKVPFETVYVHPLVRDEKGKKMSKSTGNVIDPLDLMDKYGTDAVRFTLTAMAAMGRDLKLSEDRIVGYRNFGTKLWNAARFAEFNEAFPQAGFDPKSVDQTLNKWIIGETALVREAVDTALEHYRFNDAANALYAFVWGKVCDWYVELSKPLFQGDDTAVKAETQATLAWVLDQCLVLLHPIMPYITEQLWGDITARDNMLVHQDWPTYTAAELLDADAAREMNWVVALIEQIRSVRVEMHVNAGAKIPMIQLELDDAGKAALKRNLPMILRLARVTAITQATEVPKGAVTLAVEGGTFCLPLADVIDVEAEKARLTKTIEKLEKELNMIKGKLANEKFTANAPAAVVAENRARVDVGGEELKTLQAAYARVAALG